MFNLEQQITQWRSQMLAAGIQSPVPLDELESHLRDEIERLVETGVDSQTAFETATKKIGGPVMLKDEFSKIQPAWLKRFEPIFLPLVASVITLCFASMLLLGFGNLGDLNSSQKLSALAALGSGLLLSWSGWFGYRVFSFLPVKRARGRIIGFACCLLMLWWAAFFFLVLPRNEFDMAQLILAIFWGFIGPAGLASGLAAGVKRAARRADDATEIRPPDSPSSSSEKRKNSRRWVMIVCLLLVASLAGLGIGSDGDAKGFCVIACLILSLVLPLAAGPLPANHPSQSRRWIGAMLAGQISLGACGAWIIWSPQAPVFGLIFALIGCVFFGRQLRRLSRAATPERLVSAL